MRYARFIFGALLALLIIILFAREEAPQEVHYESSWMQYKEPEEAGWSSDKLQEAQEYYRELHSTAALFIYDGKVVFAWGDVTKNTRAHSVRKSFLNALYGIYREKGVIDLNQTMGELELLEMTELTSQEKQATIADLLKSSSGVYLEAGEESWAMSRTRPPRDAHLPGTHFYYNNWDFNVLGSIFNHQTESELFKEFKDLIAKPLEMEDFSLDNTWYQFESNKSLHPSYLFRVSARDMARFGQLYLQQGSWEGDQIVPSEWIEESLQAHAIPKGFDVFGYGYLWWVAHQGEWEELGLFSAVGRYGQSIDVIPEKNIVFVHRMNSDDSIFPFYNRVTSSQRLYLLSLILDAKTGEAKETPETVPGIHSTI
ncbi:serine hydrolase domain-containing protein [Tindallia californiensis]|uniref:CubicO group peptidase, beta-lactamase class C family n=1 Tax=Tindallia californiensis TaxID=159292 RepID=A0A1H3RCX0_9FIRM|nr:serine hydrolase [Tindallia californiensis]SDZ23682.1 CubicO group peptidase, beta-lactamase class C family [Tindallia californiensis]